MRSLLSRLRRPLNRGHKPLIDWEVVEYEWLPIEDILMSGEEAVATKVTRKRGCYFRRTWDLLSQGTARLKRVVLTCISSMRDRRGY